MIESRPARRTLVAVVSAGVMLGAALPAAQAAPKHGHCHKTRHHAVRCAKKHHAAAPKHKAPVAKPQTGTDQVTQPQTDQVTQPQVDPATQSQTDGAPQVLPPLPGMSRRNRNGHSRAVIGGLGVAGTTWSCGSSFTYYGWYMDWCSKKYISDIATTLAIDFDLYYYSRSGWTLLAIYRCDSLGQNCSRIK